MARFSSLLCAIVCVAGFVLALDHVALADSPLDAWKDRQAKIKQVVEQVRPSVVAIGGGSGVIVSPDGYVLTVSHVNGAVGRRLKVSLADGRTVMATTLGSDLNSDAALVKLDGDGPWAYLSVPGLSGRGPVDESRQPTISLVATKLSKGVDRWATEPAAGDWCLAFGYPLSFPRGQPAVVRLGKISKLSDRQIIATAVVMGGDSGGPLVSMSGRLLGISSRVTTEIGSNIFVPVESYTQNWWELIAGNMIEVRQGDSVNEVDEDAELPAGPRAWLGIFGDSDQQRVRIRAVQNHSPAKEAGLTSEDVILKINDQPVQSFADVVQRLQASKPGDSWQFQLNRFGNLIDVTLILGVRP